MVFLRKLGRRRNRRRKQHDNGKEYPNGVPEKFSDDDDVHELPCSCDQCQHFLHLHKRFHSPASCPSRRSKYQNYCPYCDQKQLKPSSKHRLLTTSPKSSHAETLSSQIETPSSSEELISASEVYPILSQEKLPVPITLSATTSTDVNTNKIPSDLKERKEHAGNTFQDIYDTETSSSSRYSSSVVDAITQTSDFTIPKSTKARHKSVHRQNTNKVEELEPQQSESFQQGLYDILRTDGATEYDSSHGKSNGYKRQSYSSSKLITASKQSYARKHHESEVPLRFAIPTNNNEVYPRYKYVKQKRPKMFFVYKLVDESSSGKGFSVEFSSQKPASKKVYLEDLHKSDKQLDPSAIVVAVHSSTEQEKSKLGPEVSTATSKESLYSHQQDMDLPEASYSNESQRSPQEQTSEQRILHFPAVYVTTSVSPDISNSEGSCTDEEDQMSNKKLDHEEDESLESNPESTKKRKHIFKAFKSLFFRSSPMQKSSTECEVHLANSINSEKNNQQVKWDTTIPQDSTITEDAYKIKDLQTKSEPNAPLNNINRNDLREYSSETNKKNLTACVKCNRCVHFPGKSSASEIKEKKRSAWTQRAQKPTTCRSKQKTSNSPRLCALTSYLNNNNKCSSNCNNNDICNIKGKHLLPIPFCYWFEVIEDAEMKTEDSAVTV